MTYRVGHTISSLAEGCCIPGSGTGRGHIETHPCRTPGDDRGESFRASRRPSVRRALAVPATWVDSPTVGADRCQPHRRRLRSHRRRRGSPGTEPRQPHGATPDPGRWCPRGPDRMKRHRPRLPWVAAARLAAGDARNPASPAAPGNLRRGRFCIESNARLGLAGRPRQAHTQQVRSRRFPRVLRLDPW